ncbi:hypothetical protein U9M48_035865 [Paspalum notatum var. saurae]|uniref:Uncharacterized protein n=1 Tax=Paspalum notatum var. saurae TaxID=547442 RepID=A0AAQ3UGA6_PASNO
MVSSSACQVLTPLLKTGRLNTVYKLLTILFAFFYFKEPYLPPIGSRPSPLPPTFPISYPPPPCTSSTPVRLYLAPVPPMTTCVSLDTIVILTYLLLLATSYPHAPLANHKGYRCLDLASNHIIISRHVEH